MLLIDIVFYTVITWYFDALLPGDFGTPQPFYFPFTVFICHKHSLSLGLSQLCMETEFAEASFLQCWLNFKHIAPVRWHCWLVNRKGVRPVKISHQQSLENHSTRQKSDLHICSVQKSIGKKSIQYVGSVLWNEIPHLLKNPMSRYTFKRKLKAHLLNELAVSWVLCTVFFYYVLLLILYAHYPVALCTLHLQLHAFCYCFFLCYSIYSICM